MLTRRTRLPASANEMAVAHATEVLPTPPLPVKSRFRVDLARQPHFFTSMLPRPIPTRSAGAVLNTGPGFVG